MNYMYSSYMSRIGNSQGVRIPVTALAYIPWYQKPANRKSSIKLWKQLKNKNTKQNRPYDK